MLEAAKELANGIQVLRNSVQDEIKQPVITLNERLREIVTTFRGSINNETKSILIEGEVEKDIEKFGQIIDKYRNNYSRVTSFIMTVDELKKEFEDFKSCSTRNKYITEKELNFMRQITEIFTDFEAMIDKAQVQGNTQ